ncbi:MAG: SUMF1/EgtB/PvdO family nonheme iron enzyme, partial [Chloroflexota bacterium]
TPPGDAEPAALGLPQPPAIPPELDAIKTELAEVTGGTFMMGTTLEEATQAMDECQLYGKTCEDLSWVSDSTPPHQTTVDTFAIEVYEVSVTQFVTFLNWMGPNSHKTQCQGQPCAQTTQEQENSLILFDGITYSVRNPGFYSQHPATYVTWWGAVEYCTTLNRRLPTEAEWERAARGSQNRIYPWGFEFDIQRAMTSIVDQAGTVPVTSYPSGVSPYGAFNMAGNVSEWVYDWYQPDYYTQQLNAPDPNPKGPIAGTEKVHRGGSWDTIPLFLRSVHRMSQPPGNPTAAIGFRCVADVTPSLPVTPLAAGGAAATGAGAGGAPTLPPAPTQPPLPISTPAPSGPTPTLAPG